YTEADLPWSLSTDNKPYWLQFTLWVAVTRRERIEGRIIGPAQRLTVPQALRALTAAGAYVCCAERDRGSLAVGKLADLQVLDLDQVERNLDRMAALFADRRVRVRPHAKTHKVPNVALMQLARGAVGVCCAKLGEAEVMAAGGVSGLLITTEIVGVPKIRRLL